MDLFCNYPTRDKAPTNLWPRSDLARLQQTMTSLWLIQPLLLLPPATKRTGNGNATKLTKQRTGLLSVAKRRRPLLRCCQSIRQATNCIKVRQDIGARPLQAMIADRALAFVAQLRDRSLDLSS